MRGAAVASRVRVSLSTETTRRQSAACQHLAANKCNLHKLSILSPAAREWLLSAVF